MLPVVLRLKRIGAKKKSIYRIVATDSRKARNGAYIEAVGHYNPHVANEGEGLVFKEERLNYWLSKGAQESDTVKSLIVKFNKNKV